MLQTTDFRDRSVLVFGLGLFGGGESAARWFAERGATVTATDRRSALQLRPTLARLRPWPVRYVLGRHRRADIAATQVVIKNPGVARDHPLLRFARQRGAMVETDLGVFLSLCPAPLVGITGSKGKSTTATLTGAFLRTRFVSTAVIGNIGRPVLDRLRKLQPGVPAILELSSWQLEDLAAHRQSPHLAVWLNLSPDHLDRHRSLQGYAAAKQRLFQWQLPGDVAILNLDDPWAARVVVQPGVRTRTFSTRRRAADAFVHRRSFWLRNRRSLIRFARFADLRLPGRHLQGSVLAAALAAQSLGARPERFARVMRSFRGLPGRLETIRRLAGVDWVNDSNATTPAATLAALETIPGRLILIAGGVDKHLSYRPLARALRRRVACLVLLPGTATDKLGLALGRQPPRTAVGSMTEAVRAARRLAEPGDTVILSPAAASFNLFANVVERGEAFRRAVQRLRP